MLAPGVFLAFLWPRANAFGVLAGMIAGYFALLAPAAERIWAQHLADWDRGLVAMLVNLAVALAVSAALPARSSASATATAAP
jgi:solute:Na+ symporter, SSS family